MLEYFLVDICLINDWNLVLFLFSFVIILDAIKLFDECEIGSKTRPASARRLLKIFTILFITI